MKMRACFAQSHNAAQIPCVEVAGIYAVGRHVNLFCHLRARADAQRELYATFFKGKAMNSR
jgi:hypothetical protein